MNGALAVIVAVGVAAAGAFIAVFALQRGRNRRLKAELDKQSRLKRRAEKTADQLVGLQKTQQDVRQEAEKEKVEIDEADDSALIDHANDLFPGS